VLKQTEAVIFNANEGNHSVRANGLRFS